MPFCSARCKQIDLGRWLTEEYSLPLDPEAEETEFDPFDNDNGNGRHPEDH